jgi:hypothetical protein
MRPTWAWKNSSAANRASSGVRVAQADVQMVVASLVSSERLELLDERGHQIEGEPQRGKFAGEGHHAPVVLQRVQAHPRQDVGARGSVHVVRLVHVPEQRNAGHNGTVVIP